MIRCVAVSLMLLLALGAAGLSQTDMPEALRDIGIDQRLNEQVPLDLTFRNEAGEEVELSRYFGRKPVVLALVYYECPMLCNMILNGLLRSLRAVPLNAGEHFEIATVSFDPEETPELAAAKKREYISRYGRDGAAEGWHFLTGGQESIRALTEAVGFRYALDPKTGEWIHASGIMVLTPDGKLARYFYGVEYSARDLRLGLVEASAGKIGSPVERMLLFCYHYDPTTGKYGLVIMNVIRVAGLATLLLLGGFMLVMFRRDWRKT